MSAASYSATIVFGPNAAAAAAACREAGVPNVIEPDDIESLDFAQVEGCEITLSFAHNVPSAWSGRDLENDWTPALLGGTSLDPVDMRAPQMRVLGNEQDPSALLMLHWNDVDTGTALTVAKAIARSYAALSG